MLNISICLYAYDAANVQHLVQTLLQAETVKNIYLLDNSPEEADTRFIQTMSASRRTHYIWNEGKNIGYSKSHNIAIRESVWQRTKYHLIMKPSVEIKAEDIDKLHNFMEHNPQVGAVIPHVVDADGKTLHVCRLLPTPFDIFAKHILPAFIEEKRTYYTALCATGYHQIMNVPVLDDCFLLLRTEAALQARLIDERFFSNFWHIDLTRTIHRNYLTLFIPDITIAKKQDKTTQNQWHLLWNKTVDMCRYFNKWGWIFDSEQKEINQLTLQLCKTEQA